MAVIKQEQNGPNIGLDLVNKTVKYTNDIQIERRELIQENEHLKQKIVMLEAQSKTGDREREKFFEGASWSAKQSVQACDRGVVRANQVSLDYQ